MNEHNLMMKLFVAVVLVAASAAQAEEPCTLKRGLKVMNKGAPISLPVGAAIIVVKRDAVWSDVTVDGAARKAPTAALALACPEGTPEAAPTATTPTPTPTPAPTPEAPPTTTTEPAETPKPAAPTSITPATPMTPSSALPSTIAPGATAWRPLRVAVRPIEVTSAEDARLSRVVTDATVEEMRKLQRLSVVGFDEIKAMLDLEAEKQLAGCGDDSCIAEIVEALGIDILIIGSIARLDGEKAMVLKRIDQRAATVQSAQKRLADLGGEESLAAVGPMIAELFPDIPLRDGRTRGVSDEIELRLNPPPIPSWVTWTGFGVTAVGLATAATSGVITATIYGQRDSLKDNPTANAADYQQLNAPFLVAQGALIASSAVTVVAGTTSSVAVFFTDWNHYADRE